METALVTAEPLDLVALLVRWDRFITAESQRHGRRYRLEPEEVHQEALMRITAQFPTYDPRRGAFSTWAAIVIRRAAAALFADRGRTVRTVRPSGNPDYEGDDFLEGAVADPRSPDPLDEAADREQRTVTGSAVRAALARLPLVQRDAVYARYWLGEAASPDVRRHLRAALDALRTLIPSKPEGSDP